MTFLLPVNQLLRSTHCATKPVRFAGSNAEHLRLDPFSWPDLRSRGPVYRGQSMFAACAETSGDVDSTQDVFFYSSHAAGKYFGPGVRPVPAASGNMSRGVRNGARSDEGTSFVNQSTPESAKKNFLQADAPLRWEACLTAGPGGCASGTKGFHPLPLRLHKFESEGRPSEPASTLPSETSYVDWCTQGNQEP